jgi:hypothetical protein
MILLGTLGFFQILIALTMLGVVAFYIYALLKIWNSSLTIGTKIIYTIVAFVFPVIGLILLLLANRGVLFNVTQVNSVD